MKYWLMIDGMRQGPFSVEQVAAQPGVTVDTPVWYNGIPDWTVIANVPELACLIAGPKTPPPPAPSPWPTAQPAACPAPPYEAPQCEVCPPNYLVWAILATVLCCTPLGIVSIIYSAGVSSAFHTGNIETARRKSRLARIWIIVTVVAGLLFSVGYFLFVLSSGDLNPAAYNYDF